MSEVEQSHAFAFLRQGAIIQQFNVAGRNIVLGFPSESSYASDVHPYFGETIGRVANRISGAKIDRLNGTSYTLAANNGPNTVHGGSIGWGKRMYTGPTNTQRHGREAVAFTYLSPDGEEGFPGTVELRIWYFPSVEDIDGRMVTSLEIEYEAELVGEEAEETAVSLTNHSYFNISGGPTIEGTEVTLSTDLHLETDETSIPTGAIKQFPHIVQGEKFTLGAEEPDIDHCFLVDSTPEAIARIPLDTRARPLVKLVELEHPNTGIHLEALSTEPAFQIYTGRYTNVPALDGMPAMGPRSGMCIEAGRYVNAINQEAWRHMVVLRKGQLWGSRTIYRAWAA